jgi:hypothetical protein
MSDASGDRDGRNEDGDDGGIRFRLPPITLPDAAFPSDLQVRLPAPYTDRERGVSGGHLLAATLAVDALDAVLALAVADPVVTWLRVLAGILAAAAVTGVYATLYAWEAAAVAAGLGWLSAFPSVTGLLLLRARG